MRVESQILDQIKFRSSELVSSEISDQFVEIKSQTLDHKLKAGFEQIVPSNLVWSQISDQTILVRVKFLTNHIFLTDPERNSRPVQIYQKPNS
jgi:hypothetical protein